MVFAVSAGLPSLAGISRALIRAHSALVIVGVSSRSRRHWPGVRSKRLPSLPIVVTNEVIISSRIASSGGLVT